MYDERLKHFGGGGVVIDDGGAVEVGLPWVEKGWIYEYGSWFAIMDVGLGLSWVLVCLHELLFLFFFWVVLMVEEGGIVVVEQKE